MNTTKKINSKSVIKIVAYLLLVLVAVAFVGFMAKFTGGFTGEFKTFYLTVDGKDVMTEASDFKMAKDGEMKVDVKYTFSTPR